MLILRETQLGQIGEIGGPAVDHGQELIEHPEKDIQVSRLFQAPEGSKGIGPGPSEAGHDRNSI